ncbi:DNA replication licensing factor MCM5,putative [Plasmodium gaboni]|nr:DNA replication licensing factor MCM5,putative [Plasmodium gaboni]
MELSQFATDKHVQMSIDLFSASTAETAKQCLIFETMSPLEQKAVKQAEDAILGRLGKGQRASRVNLFRELQLRGFDRSALSKALAILIKKGELQERGDRSVRRT